LSVAGCQLPVNVKRCQEPLSSDSEPIQLAVRERTKEWPAISKSWWFPPPDPARGDRPLVFWIDKKKGIAFAFAYYPKERKRYLYKIIVFEPNKTFCPEEETTGSPKWQAIPSYALEPPVELAPNLN